MNIFWHLVRPSLAMNLVVWKEWCLWFGLYFLFRGMWTCHVTSSLCYFSPSLETAAAICMNVCACTCARASGGLNRVAMFDYHSMSRPTLLKVKVLLESKAWFWSRGLCFRCAFLSNKLIFDFWTAALWFFWCLYFSTKTFVIFINIVT